MSSLYYAGARAVQWLLRCPRTPRSSRPSQLLARFIFSGCLLLSPLIGWGLFSITGCSKGQVKLSETEQQIQKIDAFLLGLQEAYGKKDLATLRSYFSQKFQDLHPELFEAVEKTFEVTDRVQMDLTVDLIQIDGQKVKILLHWDVNSQSAKSALQYRGNTTLQLIEQETLQVTALEGDNPFVLAQALTDRNKRGSGTENR